MQVKRKRFYLNRPNRFYIIQIHAYGTREKEPFAHNAESYDIPFFNKTAQKYVLVWDLTLNLFLVFCTFLAIPSEAYPLFRYYLTPDSDLIHKTITEE